MKRLLLLLALGLGLLAPNLAQAQCPGINCTVPQSGLAFIARNKSYIATSVGLVPAASATDIFCISGSTSKTISIRKIKIAGTAGTAITTPFLVYQRSALGTAGTAATGLALPVAVPLSPTDPAATAVVTAYTANPTVAATPLLEDAALVDLPVTTAAGGAVEADLIYGTTVDNFSKGLDIPPSTTLQDCINLNGVSVSSGVLTIGIQWTESP